MGWRGVHISQAAKIGLKQRQLNVVLGDQEVTIPIEDIAFLVLDTPQCTLTGAVIAALAGSNAVFLQSDAKHHPIMIGLPFQGHHKHAHIAHIQVECSQPLKKRAWQAIVKAKIANQAAHLAANGKSKGQTKLLALMSQVTSGDSKNHEATAARAYWAALFSDYKRSDEADLRNAMLNYGYAILRATMARAVVAAGLLPAFGLFHHSVTNAFNLVDDLVEPFRPSVDALVARLLKETDGEVQGDELTLAHRRALVSVINEPVRMGLETMTMLAAIEDCAQSLVTAMIAKKPDLLKLPAFEINHAALAANDAATPKALPKRAKR
jgi:CRISP-associated protein Cas1